MHSSASPTNTPIAPSLFIRTPNFCSICKAVTMERVTGFIALFAVAMLVGNAYAYRTTITTVEIDADNLGTSEQKCREMRGRWQLQACERYLRQRGRDVLLFREIDDNQQRDLDECCPQLRQVDEQCRCHEIRELVLRQQQQERGQEGRQMLQKARNLPSVCKLRPQRCDF